MKEGPGRSRGSVKKNEAEDEDEGEGEDDEDEECGLCAQAVALPRM